MQSSTSGHRGYGRADRERTGRWTFRYYWTRWRTKSERTGRWSFPGSWEL